VFPLIASASQGRGYSQPQFPPANKGLVHKNGTFFVDAM
jgi:hypothetical protein